MSQIRRIACSVLSRSRVFLIFAGLIVATAVTGCTSSQSLTVPDDRHLAEVAMMSGRPDSAIQIYRKLVKATPQDIELLYLLGSAYNQVGDYDLALHYLLQANEANRAAGHADRGEILRETGRTHLAQGKIDAALAMLQQAAALLPADAVTQNSLGVCHSLHQQYALARSAFTAALAFEPGSLEYRNNLALGWILDDQPQKGIDVLYPTYLRGNSTAKVRQNLALAFAMKGDLEAAKVLTKNDLTKAELNNNVAYYSLWQTIR